MHLERVLLQSGRTAALVLSGLQLSHMVVSVLSLLHDSNLLQRDSNDAAPQGLCCQLPFSDAALHKARGLTILKELLSCSRFMSLYKECKSWHRCANDVAASQVCF